MAGKKRGLGRGLDALLGAAASPPVQTTTSETGEVALPEPEQHPQGDHLRMLPVDVIHKSRYQPRHDFPEESLQELADSIKAQGVVQPIVVRPHTQAGHFELIAGERRWRAAQLAGLHEIPAVVRDVPDQAAMAMGLIENIQREELNPVEEAMALQRLIEEFGLTHQEAADAVGRSRAAVSNLLRLLSLEPAVKELLEAEQMEMGHARALLALQGGAQIEAARQVARRGLSVRETENLVRKLAQPAKPKSSAQNKDPDVRRFEADLSEKLGAKVQIQTDNRGRGKLVIQYNSLDELDGILAHIK
ncbi:ParB/RepB/Spo0J family partition protein [Thiohalophilus thiocyanatoxydans]|uniref:Probable chromosome-partitioning protein ParB n=1 Tax=Thiohalophilus thiocyanatoxydans TaxID=381308 RepID=A0A4R8IRR1_9GAMM|nr:ParB/RepB/Spo0J family partition protein [Thiohalophilus thiocyanatoxydans]TDY03721.1 ParB family chromosome partitioning protein [Thiohalophilus thiocyanatoxydans]